MVSDERPLQAHHKDLKDEDTEGNITDSTTRASLYELGTRTNTTGNGLLRNMVGVSEPALRCQLSLEESELYPPSLRRSELGYDLYVAYNKLVCLSRHLLSRV